MCLFHLPSALTLFILLLTLGILQPGQFVAASPFAQVRNQQIATPLHRLPAFPPPADSGLWSKFRNRIIQKIWSIPRDAGIGDDRAQSRPPSTYLARYGNDVVLRFRLRTLEEAQALREATDVLFLDVWEATDDWVDVRMAKDIVPSLLALLPKSLEHTPTPLIGDLAKSIYEAGLSSESRNGLQAFGPFSGTKKTNPFFENYQPLPTIVHWMRLLQDLFKTHVRLISVGTSYEGRDVPAIRVGVHPKNNDKPSDPRHTIIISGGSHAREWITTSTVNYIAYSMITWYGKSALVTKLLEEFDWVFVPTLNPDGYIYTWENDRLWRKNRQETDLRFCRGIDLDRSWDFQWNGQETNSNPCSESFAGNEPFEATETRSFANWARNETAHNNVEFVGFFDLHSYSQTILYPYSYTCAVTPPSLENLEEVSLGLAKAIRLAHGEVYGVTSACEGGTTVNQKDGKSKQNVRMESGGGSALDWFYHELGVRFSYQLKLRDTGSYGFLLPKEEIIPTGEEVLNAITFFGKYLLSDRGIELDGLALTDFEKQTAPWSKMTGAEESVEDDKIQWELRRTRRR